MSPITFYKTQARVLWEWRGGKVALVKRLLITLIVAAVSFWLTAWLLPGITVERLLDAVVVVIVMALINAIIRPLVLGFVGPRSLILTGISVLVLQVLVFLVACNVAPGVNVDRFTTALIGSFVYAGFNTLLTAILGVDSGDSFYGLLIQSLLVERAAEATDQPGLVIIQIDGLAHPILAGRVRAGSVNTMAGWIRDGSHKLSQLGGDPALDDLGQPGRDPPRQQRRHPGLPLVRAGPPAPDGLEQPGRRRRDRPPRLERRGPAVEQRGEHLQPRDRRRHARLPHHGGDQGRGPGDRRQQGVPGLLPEPHRVPPLVQPVRRRVRQGAVPGAPHAPVRGAPQMHRGMKYAGMRAASNVLLRDVNTSLIIEEMYRGANVIYADFTDYDELAHHCGPERVESFEALDGVDRAIATLEKAAKDAPRPYRFVVLSDHGQRLGETFKQRYGKSLGEVVRDLMSGRATLVQAKTAAEGSTFVNSFLSEITRSHGIGPTVARAALAGQTKDGVVTSTPRRCRRRPTSRRSRSWARATSASCTSPATTTG